MKFTNLDVGYEPRQSPYPGILAGVITFLLVSMILFPIVLMIAPIRDLNGEIDVIDSWDAVQSHIWYLQGQLRLWTCLGSGVVAGVVTFLDAWIHTPITEPFVQSNEAHPRVFYDDNARRALCQRLSNEPQSEPDQGLYLAPHIVLPRSAELKNIMVVGAPNSGESNIIRALIDQLIARQDRLLILCNKGDMTQSFSADEAILIAPHHAESYALDLAADISDMAAAMQFAVDIIPESTPVFWSECARLIFADIVVNEIITRGSMWTARTLLDATLQDSETIRRSIGGIQLNSGVLLVGSGGEDEDKTVAGIMMSLRSAAFANLRFLAWTSESVPKNRQFSVKKWLAAGYCQATWKTDPLTTGRIDPLSS